MRLHLALLVVMAALLSVHCTEPSGVQTIVIPAGKRGGESVPLPVNQPMVPGIKGADSLNATQASATITPQLTATGAGWRTTFIYASIGSYGQLYMNSPTCPPGYEATACGVWSGRTVVVPLYMNPSTDTGKTTLCYCGYTNVVSAAQPFAYYYCKVYCQ